MERASKLTTQLLAFARRQPLKPQLFDVGQQVEGFAQMVRPLVGSRIRVETEIADPQSFTVADIAQFETALINLVVNARDAMHGEGELEISVRKVDRLLTWMACYPGRAGSFVAISVRDTGTGIAPVNLTAIFEPFFTTKEVGKGTGLGLSQAFGFAKQSGGDIAVASHLGQGSTFTIYLPEAIEPAPQEKRTIAREEAATSDRPYRVLVVEDNDEVGRFSTGLLEDLGYVVKRACNASEAISTDLLKTSLRPIWYFRMWLCLA